jgi:TATA-binding protein-associated factor Taf7
LVDRSGALITFLSFIMSRKSTLRSKTRRGKRVRYGVDKRIDDMIEDPAYADSDGDVYDEAIDSDGHTLHHVDDPAYEKTFRVNKRGCHKRRYDATRGSCKRDGCEDCSGYEHDDNELDSEDDQEHDHDHDHDDDQDVYDDDDDDEEEEEDEVEEEEDSEKDDNEREVDEEEEEEEINEDYDDEANPSTIAVNDSRFLRKVKTWLNADNKLQARRRWGALFQTMNDAVQRRAGRSTRLVCDVRNECKEGRNSVESQRTTSRRTSKPTVRNGKKRADCFETTFCLP